MPATLGTNYPTQMPLLTETADIQVALQLYHWGGTTEPTGSALTTSGGGVTGALYRLKNNPTFVGTVTAPVLSVTGASTLTGKVSTTSAGLILPLSTITDNGAIAWDNTYKNLSVGTGSTNLNVPTFAVNTTPKTSTAYTLAATDANTLVQMNGALAFNVPTNASVAFPIGTQIHLLALTTGVTVAAVTPATTTVLSTPGAKLRAANSMATLIKIDTDKWVLTGDLMA